jgi:hypothetical protein
MPTDSGPERFDPTDALMSVTMDVSRAHLLLSGTLDWVPQPVRPHTDEALDILEDAITALRDIAVALAEAEALARATGQRSGDHRGHQAG